MSNKIKFDYEPHSKQQEIHSSCSLASENTWTVVCAGRQAGKSKCAKYQAILWALQNNKSNVWYITPNESQAKIVFRDIFVECSKLGLIKNKIQSKGDIHIQFTNDSKIEFKSAASEDSLRGSSVNFLVLDECAFIKRETIEEIILPTLGVTGKKILVISTPKGKNYFYELFMRAKSDNEDFKKDYKSFRFSSKDNPKANLKLLEQFKASIPDAVYRQEFEAQFVDSAGVFNNIHELSIMRPLARPLPGDRYYMAADIALAAKGDYTVITVINNRGEMVYMDRFRGLEAPELRGRIINTYNLFKPVYVTIEENNQGLPIIQDLKKVIRNLQGFRTTQESKSEIINQLIAAFSLKEIRVLDDDNLRAELEAFIFKFTPTGKIKFEASSGFHDDIVMSLAICWWSYAKTVKTGGYSVYGHSSETSNKVVKSSNRFIFKSNDERGYLNGDDGNEFIFFT